MIVNYNTAVLVVVPTDACIIRHMCTICNTWVNTVNLLAHSLKHEEDWLEAKAREMDAAESAARES